MQLFVCNKYPRTVCAQTNKHAQFIHSYIRYMFFVLFWSATKNRIYLTFMYYFTNNNAQLIFTKRDSAYKFYPRMK